MERSELKNYIKEKGLEITVKKSMSDDDLRDAIREALKDSDEGDDSDDDDDDDDDEEEKPKSKISLDEIRKKLGKK